MVQSDSLEIFKQNYYISTNLGYVSNNAYLSIVVTNNCQCDCTYCINSETDKTQNLPIEKAINNINKLVSTYGIKEAILLGGEPLMHPELFELIKRLRTETNLQFIRLTTNGLLLKNNKDFIKKLVDKNYGIQGINISYHSNKSFMKLEDLANVYDWIKEFNSDIKVRINSNIYKNNLDTLRDILEHLQNISFADEVRISNIIPKDSFSVNSKNKTETNSLVLSDEKYNELFNGLIKHYEDFHTIFENKNTLGFVRYVLIPTKCAIIINWNIGSTVSEQVCENNILERKINTFKCLVNGEISLSWNNDNIIS